MILMIRFDLIYINVCVCVFACMFSCNVNLIEVRSQIKPCYQCFYCFIILFMNLILLIININNKQIFIEKLNPSS